MTAKPIRVEATNMWLSSHGARIGANGWPSGVEGKKVVLLAAAPPANGPPPPPGTAGCASRSLTFSKNGPCEVHSGFHNPGVGCTAAVIPSRSSSAHSGS